MFGLKLISINTIVFASRWSQRLTLWGLLVTRQGVQFRRLVQQNCFKSKHINWMYVGVWQDIWNELMRFNTSSQSIEPKVFIYCQLKCMYGYIVQAYMLCSRVPDTWLTRGADSAAQRSSNRPRGLTSNMFCFVSLISKTCSCLLVIGDETTLNFWLFTGF